MGFVYDRSAVEPGCDAGALQECEDFLGFEGAVPEGADRVHGSKRTGKVCWIQ